MENKKLKPHKSDIFWIIVSCIASVIIWLSVTARENTTVTLTLTDLKIDFVGESDTLQDRKLVVTDRSADMASLTVRMKRGAEKLVTEDSVTVSVDLRDIRSAGISDKIYTVSFKNLDDSEVEIIRKLPETVSVTVEQVKTVPVPVKLEPLPKDCADEGYVLASEQPDFSPKEIKVTGPESVLNQISAAKVNIERHNLTKTVTGEVGFTLMNEDGSETELKWLSTDADRISYEIPVEMMKVVPLKVKVISGGGAGENNAQVTIDPPSVTLTGDEKYLSVIHEIVLGTFDLSSFAQSRTETLPIPLPGDVTNRSGETEAVVEVRIVGLTTSSITTTDVRVDNVPEGYVAKLKSNSVDFLVRGPAESVSRIETKDIQVVADLSGYGDVTGRPITVPVTIIIFGHNDVGIFGEYSVTLTLEEDIPEDLPPEEGTPETAEVMEGGEEAA